jgi:hypothetical protein
VDDFDALDLVRGEVLKVVSAPGGVFRGKRYAVEQD